MTTETPEPGSAPAPEPRRIIGRGTPAAPDPAPEPGAEPSLYDAVGGMPFFEALVDRFYEGVAADPVLLRLYPEPGDLAAARRRLSLFLAQYWGGPTTYSDERGHPRLRARHFPFAIGPLERDRWLVHMRAAIARLDPPPEIAARLHAYFDMAAEAMRNQD